MTEDKIKISADNLRADFLNANTTWERWKVLNRALEWATAASENANAHLRAVDTLRKQGYVRHSERIISNGEHTIRAGDVITWAGMEKGWIVKGLSADNLVDIAPLADNWATRAQRVKAEALL